MKFNIGTEIDLQKLTETRALIQANSGGGKSYLLRKIAEEVAGKIPIIILDMEGEFGTLREVYDFILIGKEGDISIEAKHADKLAKTLLSLNASAIVDLYEYSPEDKRLFVRKFCDALINIEKKYWHPTIIIIDEAHNFVPERGQAQSSNAVISLLTRGRKRGFCTILATQRLSKLHKDAAAECNNKFIGRTGLDIDMKRASEELGFTSKVDMLSLRTLGEGQFFVFGPAISNEVKKIQVSKVRSTHPKSGQRILTATPAPNDAIKQMIQQMKDIPQEAEKELQTIQSMQAEIHRLKVELRKVPAAMGPTIDAGEIKRLNEEKRILIHDNHVLETRLNKILAFIKHIRLDLESGINKFLDEIEKTPKAIIIPQMQEKKFNQFKQDWNTSKEKPRIVNKSAIGLSDIRLGKAQKLILAFLLLDPTKSRSTQQLGAMTGYSYTSGSFNTYLSELTTNGFIQRSSKQVTLNPDRIEEIRSMLQGEIDPSEFSIKHWLNKLGRGPKLIYEYLLQYPNDSFAVNELAEATGYHVSGSFNTYLSRLSTLGLIKRENGKCRIDPEIILEEF